MHMHDGKIALEKFGLDIRDSTGAQATFSEMHLWLYVTK
jgi:hypothetical protein